MKLEEVLGQITGQSIVAVEDEYGGEIEWNEREGWLTSFDGPVFVLSNGVRLRSLGEPIEVDLGATDHKGRK